jgi:hypothetical protein
MATGGIVAHDPAAVTFVLPPEPAAALKLVVGGPRGAALAGLTQHVGLLAQMEDQMIECFRHGAACPTRSLRPPGAPGWPRSPVCQALLGTRRSLVLINCYHIAAMA